MRLPFLAAAALSLAACSTETTRHAVGFDRYPVGWPAAGSAARAATSRPAPAAPGGTYRLSPTETVSVVRTGPTTVERTYVYGSPPAN